MSHSLSRAELEALLALLARGPIEVEVDGPSMHPTLRAGERVVVRAGAPRPGEIALLERSGRLVVHRLERLEAGRAWLRGDGNVRSDPPVEPSALLGVVVAVIDERGGRRAPSRSPRLRRLLSGVVRSLARLRARASR